MIIIRHHCRRNKEFQDWCHDFCSLLVVVSVLLALFILSVITLYMHRAESAGLPNLSPFYIGLSQSKDTEDDKPTIKLPSETRYVFQDIPNNFGSDQRFVGNNRYSAARNMEHIRQRISIQKGVPPSYVVDNLRNLPLVLRSSQSF